MREDGGMPLDPGAVADLDVALNEAEVAGLVVDAADEQARLLLYVLALPAKGPIAPDNRRALVLSGVSEVRVVLRPDSADGYGPVIVLGDVAELAEWFAGPAFRHEMYGWRFLDQPSLTGDWPAAPSLSLRLRDRPAWHELYWFAEFGREEPDGVVGYCLEGTVRFDDLAVADAAGAVIPLDEFTAAARRWWQAFRDKDPRVSVEAQQKVGESRLLWP
jgi:hypothetical protein